ncbi:MAG: peptidylprolyl isomerase [Thermoprotei archaeon]|nr:MAG: peptidylprolyl isomerase [Thermoprotei archaeon]
MPFEKNDFILIDYTATIKETGELIDTTIADVAKKHKKYSEGKVYEPLLVILGEHRVVEGLEEELAKMNIGEEKTIEVPPEKAYGRRDPNKVKLMPLRNFTRRGIYPKVGEVVEINGVPATIRNITGGRVIVDFNHPLAGKTIVYQVKVLKKIEDPLEKVKYLLHRRLRNIPPEKFTVKVVEGSLRVDMPKEAYLIDNIQYVKQTVAKEIEKYVPIAPTVEFVEKYTIKLPEVQPVSEKKVEAKSTG